MLVYKSGTLVKTKLSNIEGIITATSIRFKSVTYEVCYFNNGEYKSAWLSEFEFTVTDGKKHNIGFLK